MKFLKHKKHLRMLTDGTSDTVNLMQGSVLKDTIPDLQQITPLIRELSEKEGVIALILFGSVARGQVKNTSDIDLCIIAGKNLPKSGRWDLLSYGSERIDVNLFWDLPVMIRFRVIQEGTILFCRDATALHRIKVDTVRQYLDIVPLIRRHCLHAIGTKV